MRAHAQRLVAPTGLLFASLATALLTHAILGWAQAGGFLQGDYGQHAHRLVLPVAISAVAVGIGALLLYVLHLIGDGSGALPTLARGLAAQLNWRGAVAIGLIGAATLAGMESGEQFASGHVDGLLSAFGAVPVAGFALIVLFAAATNFILRSICEWFAGAHELIVHVLAFLLGASDDESGASQALALEPAFLTGCSARSTSRIYGRRAPPRSR